MPLRQLLGERGSLGLQAIALTAVQFHLVQRPRQLLARVSKIRLLLFVLTLRLFYFQLQSVAALRYLLHFGRSSSLFRHELRPFVDYQPLRLLRERLLAPDEHAVAHVEVLAVDAQLRVEERAVGAAADRLALPAVLPRRQPRLPLAASVERVEAVVRLRLRRLLPAVLLRRPPRVAVAVVCTNALQACFLA